MLAEVSSSLALTWRAEFDSGLEALLSDDYDVCLLDYQLGERTGLELLREARRRGGRTPVIILTGNGSPELDRESMHAGAADYLVKGDFTVSSLDHIIRYLLQRTDAEEALRESEERHALALEGSNDGLWDWRVGEQDIHLSARWKRILGYASDELPDFVEEWFSRVHQDDYDRLRHDFDTYLESPHIPHFENEHRLLHRDGTWRHVLVRGKTVRDAKGRATRVAGSLTDVTMARSRDPLTGLANRVLYLDRLEHSFQRSLRDPEFRFALLFIDIDRFKNVNDSLGHDAGDKLLVSMARRLESCIRAVDTVARLGGDEFVVLLDESREPDGATRAARRILEELARPFPIAGREIFTSASIGIAVSSGHYRTSGELLRDADTAMYRAKSDGRGRFAMFDSTMHARALQVLTIESGLRRALELNQLEVFYQPVVSLGEVKPLGFEALVRWRHPERGLISPADFIPVAEDSNLIILLDLFVMRTAATQVKAWRDEFGLELSISVNASRRHFLSDGYAIDVQQAIEVSGLPAHALRLEVTENLTMEMSGHVKAQLQAIHALGVNLYVDDFGVGYSSLSMLQKFPFSGIKLDRSFVMGLAPGSSSNEVVRAIVGIAHALHLDVVAEGVETESQEWQLMALGCSRGQGYMYARPMPADQMTSWLERFRPHARHSAVQALAERAV